MAHNDKRINGCAYIFSVDDGRGVASVINQNHDLEEVAWEEYRNA